MSGIYLGNGSPGTFQAVGDSSGSSISGSSGNVLSGAGSSLGNFLTSSSGIGSIASLLGTGLGAYNQQQNYNVLQNALKTIGPTQLQSPTITGPGGMSGSYNSQTGAGNIDLGSLNGAFGNLTNAGTAGSAGYNSSLIPTLTGAAGNFLNPAGNTLTGAYGNYNAGMSAANTQLGALNDTYGQVYGNTLNSLIAQQTPAMNQQAFGLQNTLFGNGVAGSTGATSGAIAAGNFGSQVNAQLAQDRLTAQQQALAAQSAGVQNYGSLTNSANGILSNALTNYGNTNQLISGLNTAGLTNSLQALQGAGALNTLGLNNYNAGIQSASAEAQARNMSLFPYASVATALSGTENGMTALANLLSGAGNSLSGGSNGLTGLLSKMLGGGNNNPLSSLFSGSGSSPFVTGNPEADMLAAQNAGYIPSAGSAIAGGDASIASDLAGFNPGADMASNLSIDVADPLAGSAGSAATGLGAGAADAGAAGAAGDMGAGLGADASAWGADAFGADAASGAADMGAASSGIGGASGGMAGALGSLGAVALPAAIMAYAMSQPAATMGAGYTNNILSGLNTGLTGFGTGSSSLPAVSTPYGGLSSAQNNALSEVANSLYGSGGQAWQVPQSVLSDIQSNPALSYELNQLDPATMQAQMDAWHAAGYGRTGSAAGTSLIPIGDDLRASS